jgi:hypothetical protein
VLVAFRVCRNWVSEASPPFLMGPPPEPIVAG